MTEYEKAMLIIAIIALVIDLLTAIAAQLLGDSPKILPRKIFRVANGSLPTQIGLRAKKEPPINEVYQTSRAVLTNC